MLLGFLLMSLFATLSRILTGTLLNPTGILTLSWGIIYLLCFATADWYYPVDQGIPTQISIYLGAFAVSGLITSVILKIPRRPLLGFILPQQYWGADLLLLACIAALPFYIEHQLSLSDAGTNVIYGIRRAALEGRGETVLANFLNVSFFLVVFYLLTNRRGAFTRRSLIALIVCGAYSLFTGSKLNIILLILVTAYCYFFRAYRVKKRVLIIAAILSIASFMAGLSIINFGTTTLSQRPAFENLMRTMIDYLIGGMIALSQHFDIIMQFPNSQTVTRVFASFAPTFGIRVDLPSLHAPYVNIANDNLTNVYTAFFPYLMDFGVFGTALYMAILGVLLTWIYAQAARGNLFFRIINCIMAVFVFQTVFNESIFYNFLFLLKGIVVIFICIAPTFVRLPTIHWIRKERKFPGERDALH